jgi:hypothetical protein
MEDTTHLSMLTSLGDLFCCVRRPIAYHYCKSCLVWYKYGTRWECGECGTKLNIKRIATNQEDSFEATLRAKGYRPGLSSRDDGPGAKMRPYLPYGMKGRVK